MTNDAKTEGRTAPRRVAGRPRSAAGPMEVVGVRGTPQQRAHWRQVAERSGEGESEWGRAGLDVWANVCERAAKLNTNPAELVTTALEDHDRVVAAVAELMEAGELSPTERRLLRVLSPGHWREWANANADAE